MILRPILLLVLLNLFIPLCSAQTISIVSSQWPPYVDDSIPEKGLAVELVNKALQRKGYQPTLHIYNWQRALEGVESGESLFLRKLVLGIPAQASGKNLTRPPMPSAPRFVLVTSSRPNKGSGHWLQMT